MPCDRYVLIAQRYCEKFSPDRKASNSRIRTRLAALRNCELANTACVGPPRAHGAHPMALTLDFECRNIAANKINYVTLPLRGLFVEFSGHFCSGSCKSRRGGSSRLSKSWGIETRGRPLLNAPDGAAAISSGRKPRAIEDGPSGAVNFCSGGANVISSGRQPRGS